MGKTINLKEYIVGNELGEGGICYTKKQVEDAVATKADKVHSHDNLYYTESEIDTKIQSINGAISDLSTNLSKSIKTKADADHDHDTVYAPKSHKHTVSDIDDFAHGHEATAITYNGDTVASELQSLSGMITDLQTANWDIDIVTALPNPGEAKVGKLYFVHDNNADDTVANAFDEYIFTGGEDGKFEKIGQRKIDLSNYVTGVDLTFSDGILGITLTKGNAFTL